MANPTIQVQVKPYSSGSYTDLTPYIAAQGLKWSRNDVDAKDSGRECQNGLLYRKRVAQKIRLDITCRPLLAAELNTVLNAIDPEWLKVKFYNPLTNTTVEKKMYTSTVPAAFCFDDGVHQYWTGVEFPLIEA